MPGITFSASIIVSKTNMLLNKYNKIRSAEITPMHDSISQLQTRSKLIKVDLLLSIHVKIDRK